jgi:hypothetical protein
MLDLDHHHRADDASYDVDRHKNAIHSPKLSVPSFSLYPMPGHSPSYSFLVDRCGQKSTGTPASSPASVHHLSPRRDALTAIIIGTLATVGTPSWAANDETDLRCDDECLAERRRIIQERRAMMQQSRTTTRRQDLFDLSRQRAALYNTTYQGASCAPGVPCL